MLRPLWLLLVLLTPSPALANPPDRGMDSRRNEPVDATFPDAGGVAATAATGVPFLAMGELAYGFTDSAALGVLLGVAPTNIGLGLRPRVLARLNDTLRLSFVVPSLYYPPCPNPRSSSWILTRPVALLEHGSPSGLRIGAGSGVIVAGPVRELFEAVGAEPPAVPAPSVYDDAGMEPDAGFRVWETLLLTTSVPVAERSSAFAEAGVVLDGVDIAGSDWVAGPPVIVVLGITRAL
jgi:hypothetical protein